MPQTRFAFLSRSLKRFYERYAELVDALLATGVDVEVVAPPADVEVNLRGASHKAIPSSRRWSPGRDLLVGPILVAHYASAPPALIHVVDASLVGSALYVAKTLGIPHVALSLDPYGSEVPCRVPPVKTHADRLLGSAHLAWLPRVLPHLSLTVLHGRAHYQETLLSLPEDNTTPVIPLDTGMGVSVEAFMRESGYVGARKLARKTLGITREFVVTIPLFDGGKDTVIAGLKLASHAARQGHAVVVLGGETLAAWWQRGLRKVLGREGIHTTRDRRLAYDASDLVAVTGVTPRQSLYVMEAAASRVPAMVPDLDLYRAIVRDGSSGWSYPATSDAREALDKVIADRRGVRHAGREAQTRSARLFERRLAVKRLTRAYEQIFSDTTVAGLDEQGMVAAFPGGGRRELVKERS